MSKYKVEISNVNTSNLKVLSHEEMIKLFERYKSGDNEAKNELVLGNLKLVLSILKSFNNRENMDDLFQVGCVGLIRAIDNFDLSYNVKFSTYAVPMILGEIKRSLRDNSSLRISRSIKDIAYKIIKLSEIMTNKNGKEPTPKELAKELNMEEYEIAEALNSMKETKSIFEPIYNDGGDTIYLFDQLESKQEDKDINISINEAIKNLKEKEQYIINERYIMGKTQLELANDLGISQAQISRLEKNGIEKIKKMIK